MTQRVLLTGGRGFFGRRLAEVLRRRGYELATPGRPEFDLLDPSSVERAFTEIRPDWVVHSAAYYGGLGICIAEPARIFRDNTLMLCNVLDAAGRHGASRFVSIGSACAYPGGVVGDMRELDYWSGPLHGTVEAYGFTKKIQQVGMQAYKRQYGLEIQTPILTNLYGEHDVFQEYRSHVAAALIKRFADAVLEQRPTVECWGTGSPVREFLYVGDAAEGVARLLETDFEQPVNLGTGIGTTIRELAEAIARHAEFEGEIVWDTDKPDGAGRKVLDVQRMREVLAWEPPTSLDEGLARTIAWYVANKELADART